jgi:long-subunit acyl-CoA synthetase (AMP-forming)
MSTVAEQRPDVVEAAPGAATLCDAFQAVVRRYADQVALRDADGSVEITFAEYAERVRRIAAGLAALGVRRGDTVGLMMSNRPEFHLCDTAAFHLGATPFSLYNTLARDQLVHVLDNAECRVVIAEPEYLDRLRAARGERGQPSELIDVESLAELEERGDPQFDFEAVWRAVAPGDVLTLIYTSGTTGPSKGVEITHANMLAECRAVASVLPVRPGARITSYLPSAHIADRWSSHYNQIVFGIQITDVADPRQIAAVLPQLRPTIWGGVPRVLEKLKAGFEAKLAGDTEVQRAIAIGREKVRLEQARRPVPEELARRHAAADEQVLSKLRAALGLDEAEWILVGAAPMSGELHEWLLALGLPVLELYGMSEASCVLTVCPPSEAKIGSVGRPIPGVELRVAEDGELLACGPTIMRGYRGAPDKTAEAIDEDGWLHTGDIVTVDDDGHVRIVDRKKELIINAAGKNMSPANIELELKSACPLIGQACVIGDRRPYNIALLVLEADVAGARAREDVLAEIRDGVARANDRLSRVEQIKRYEVLADEWLPGGDELTPTMKVRRKPIAEKYAETIERLYEA